MTERTSVQQSLAALVACDQSYLYPAEGQKVKRGDPLGVLRDGSGASTNDKLYTDSPAFAIPSGYTVEAALRYAACGFHTLYHSRQFRW